MNVLVCIKQIPDTSNVRIDRKTNNLIREGIPAVINPDDLKALELGAQLKEKYSARVAILTMGPPQAINALRDAMIFGLDEAFLLSDRAFAGADTLATTYALNLGINKIETEFGKFDLILTGKQAADGDTGQVGPGIATRRKYSLGAYVEKIEEINDTHIIALRRLDRGYERIKIKIPALLTITEEFGTPRYGSLPDLIKAIKYQPKIFNAKDIGADLKKCGFFGSPTRVVRTNIPPARKGGDIISKNESPQEVVEKLFEVLKSFESIRLSEMFEKILGCDKL
ncbi:MULTISPECIES: electron transfer flavoprotein subunit beta/FixA family protein [unclassified Marinitoga]|uniref:electron transfer flavoprotein subunit beta/FixA family protein n=1 Tax=unclassified Marinitoga TaxID=2640159 RepID=UPI000640CE46|nr:MULTISPECIES: electron transfer flavoprotein subunit beta/FixA family protein [unclassified Marinitoga]KLO23940.1 electron transfer flavoprotein subunit beta [Marinitoga sp. 1155]NUU99170.1 electron transfer flavoprotein subunit beta [Marinitoga sp. 1154]